MKSMNWLHFSDLHFGQIGQEWLWPTFRNNLFEDLKRLFDLPAGPWDVVFFSGDLTQAATKEQFAKLSEALEQLWGHFASLGCAPLLICVPGNHDLSRPLSTNPVVKALRHWHDDPDIKNLFWSKEPNDYREEVIRSFSNYDEWLQNLRLPKPSAITDGLLPGDFSTTINKMGFRVGVVGLNTGFLQLTDEDYEERLDLHEQQLCAVCAGDPDAWCESQDITVLLTHHGYSWLHESAKARFLSEIYPPGRFFSHIYGHLHNPSSQNFSHGGAEERRFRQGPSLFGSKMWGNDRQERIHGYTAGRFELSGTEGIERFWPRRLAQKMGGHRALSPDVHYDLDENNCVVTKFKATERAGSTALDAECIDEQKSEALIHKEHDSANTEVDTFDVGSSLLDDEFDFEYTKKQLTSVPKLKLSIQPQHYGIRQAEQARLESLLLKDRCAWLLSDWGLGKEGFLACVLERLGRQKIHETYRVVCEEADDFEQFENEVVKQFGMTLQEFCNLNATLTNTILIFDDISPSLITEKQDHSIAFHRLLSSILDFCPRMCLIAVSRQIPADTSYEHVVLKPLDITETANYISNHPKAAPELRSVDAIDALHLRSEGLPMHLERLIETLQVSSLGELTDLELSTPFDHVVDREPVPRALKQAVSSISQSTDRYTRRSYRMLKVLSVLPEGESLLAIRRTYPTEPFFPRNAVELIDLSLMKVESQPSIERPINSNKLCIASEQADEDKRLCVPRQVRDYINSILSREECEEIIRCSADLLFGDKWREGKIRINRDRSLGVRGARSTGPGNEHAILLKMLYEAIQRQDSREVNQILRIALNYCSKLYEHNRFRDACIATEDLLSVTNELDPDREHAELTIIRGKSLRMTGQRDKALEMFESVLACDHQFLSKTRLADVYLSIALIHETARRMQQAIDSAEMVQQLVEKDTGSYMHADSILVSCREKDPKRKSMLQDIERRARIRNHLIVANNIALDLSRHTDNESEKLSLVERVLLKADDPYNRIRAVVDKANFLLSRNKVAELTPRDRQLLGFAYSFLFAQRLTSLFGDCHKALWKLMKFENQIANLLRIFRLSSFIWRIRGEDNLERKHLGDIEEIDLTEVRKLHDERAIIDIGYFERRQQRFSISMKAK